MKYDNKKTCSHTIDLNNVLFINLIHIKYDKDGSFNHKIVKFNIFSIRKDTDSTYVN